MLEVVDSRWMGWNGRKNKRKEEWWQWMDGWMEKQIECGEMRDGIFRRLLIIIFVFSRSPLVISLTNEKCGEQREDRTVTESNHPTERRCGGVCSASV